MNGLDFEFKRSKFRVTTWPYMVKNNFCENVPFWRRHTVWRLAIEDHLLYAWSWM